MLKVLEVISIHWMSSYGCSYQYGSNHVVAMLHVVFCFFVFSFRHGKCFRKRESMFSLFGFATFVELYINTIFGEKSPNNKKLLYNTVIEGALNI